MEKKAQPYEKKIVLAKKNVLSGIDLVYLEICASCLARKQNRVTFRSSPSKIKNILDLIHSNLFRPMLKSIGGPQYFVPFIDNHS